MEQDPNQIQGIVDKLIESQNSEDVNQYIQEVFAQEKGAITKLIEHLGQNIQDITKANPILKSLRILTDKQSELIVPQLKENEKIPQLVVQYISNNKVEDMGEGNIFILFNDSFTANHFKDVCNEKFITKILDDLEFIKNDTLFKFIVRSLMLISNQAEDAESSLVIKILNDHFNSRYVSEIYVQLLNRVDEKTIDYTIPYLKFLKDIMKCTKGFFYSNDLNVLIDIILKEIANISEDKIRLHYLQSLFVIVKHEDYVKTSYHRAADISEIMEELNCSTCSQEIKDLGNEITNFLEDYV